MPKGAYKFTRERKDPYLGHLRQGVGRCKAAILVGINVKTVEREIAKGNGFIAERDDAGSFALDEVEESVFDAVRKGNGYLGFKVLEVRRPDLWAPKKGPLPGSPRLHRYMSRLARSIGTPYPTTWPTGSWPSTTRLSLYNHALEVSWSTRTVRW